MMHFDGTHWTRETPHAIRGIIGHFTAVADAGPNDIWMIGKTRTDPTSLAVHYDGREWTRVDMADPGAGSTFSGVCTLGGGRALAVGTVDKFAKSEPVAEVWDGSQWNIEDTADLQRRHNSFSGVTCLGDDEAWAVGTSSTDDQDTSLLEHRTAAGWVRVHEADQPNAQLAGVVALPSGEVWAVGYQSTHGGADVAPLVVHGVGATWTASTVPYRHAGAKLTCVAADGPDDVWVAGNEGVGDGRPVFVDHWDGSTWTRSL